MRLIPTYESHVLNVIYVRIILKIRIIRARIIRDVFYLRSLIAARERPRVSARSDGAHRDARALPAAPTPPTTRPDDYLDVPSLLERTASARSRLLVHVDKPTVLSEARRWVLRAVRRHNKRGK